MKPKFTDNRRRYHDAQASSAPGYLRRRFKAIMRLQRIKAAKSNVQPLEEARAKKASSK